MSSPLAAGTTPRLESLAAIQDSRIRELLQLLHQPESDAEPQSVANPRLVVGAGAGASASVVPKSPLARAKAPAAPGAADTLQQRLEFKARRKDVERAQSALGLSPSPRGRDSAVSQDEVHSFTRNLLTVHAVDTPPELFLSSGAAAAASPSGRTSRSTALMSPLARQQRPSSSPPTRRRGTSGYAPLNFDGHMLTSPSPAGSHGSRAQTPQVGSPPVAASPTNRGHGGRFRPELHVYRARVTNRARRISSTLTIANTLEEDADVAAVLLVTSPTPASPVPSSSRARVRPQTANVLVGSPGAALRKRPMSSPSARRSSPAPSKATPKARITPGRVRPASSTTRRKQPAVHTIAPARATSKSLPRSASATRMASPSARRVASPSTAALVRSSSGLFSPVSVGSVPRATYTLDQPSTFGEMVRQRGYRVDTALRRGSPRAWR